MPNIPVELRAALDDVRDLLSGDALPPWPQANDDRATLATARDRLERRYTLAVVGEFSSGKSYLLNALLGKVRYDDHGRIAGLLAVDINPSTATITELEYAPVEAATARYPSGRTERIPFDRLARFIAVGREERGGLHDATADDDAAPAFVTVDVDSPFLQRGFVIADTPGLASLNPAHRRATLGYLPRTDAVLYLIDTQQPFSEGDAAFLGLIGEHVRTIFIVQTKIDLWRTPDSDGREAWQHARERIVSRARRLAPTAEVLSVSARDFAKSQLDDDAELAERSGFPQLLAALDRSLAERAQAARVARTAAVLTDLVGKASARVRREIALAETSASALQARLEIAESELGERERQLARERDDVLRAGRERRGWVAERGHALAADAIRAVGTALDVADIERIRDRGKLHVLIDGAAAAIFSRFGEDVAGHVSRALERVARERSGVGIADIAALQLGGEPGVGAWSRDLAAGIASTIVLGAIGGPTVSLVAGIAAGFAAHPFGAYMKRELGADLDARIFPAFESDVRAFVDGIADAVGRIYDDLADRIERERAAARGDAIDPIVRALAFAGDAVARERNAAGLEAAARRLATIDRRLAALAGHDADEIAPPAAPAISLDSAAPASFDPNAYDRGLSPERWRVAVLGGLRRGKSSLINAIAGTRLLHDDGGAEATFPIHVRYGDANRAYGLEPDGTWCEVDVERAVARATRTPVLIEVPWNMPRQLVLVHAPAFDSGDAEAEGIALKVAGAATEVLALFSRQLSDRELALYTRVAESKPMLFAHTIADNETSAERRNVVELAGRYLRERGVAPTRIFTISALDELESAQLGRRAAAWNELGALRETLRAHAEEHMRRLAERARRTHETPVETAPAVSSRPNLRRALDRFFGRS